MDIKTFDKSGELVRNKGQFKFIDPTANPLREFEPEYIYKVDAGEGSWVRSQIEAGAFTLVDDEGNDIDAPEPKAGKTKTKAPAPAPTGSPAPAPAPAA